MHRKHALQFLVNMESLSDMILRKIREIRRELEKLSATIIVSDDNNDDDDEDDVIFIGETIVISDDDEDIVKEIGNYPV